MIVIHIVTEISCMGVSSGLQARHSKTFFLLSMLCSDMRPLTQLHRCNFISFFQPTVQLSDHQYIEETKRFEAQQGEKKKIRWALMFIWVSSGLRLTYLPLPSFQASVMDSVIDAAPWMFSFDLLWFPWWVVSVILEEFWNLPRRSWLQGRFIIIFSVWS